MSRNHQKYRLPRWAAKIVRPFAVYACDFSLDDDSLWNELRSRLEDHFGVISRPVRFILLAAFLLFDQLARLRRASFGRRFASLRPEHARAYFDSMIGGRPSWRRRVTNLLCVVVLTHYYDIPRVRERVGYEPTRYVARRAAERLHRYGETIREAEEALFAPVAPASALRRVEEWRAHVAHASHQDPVIECDAVVIGSGTGGATVGAELADRGWDVVILEEGGWHVTDTFDTSMTRAVRDLYRDGGVEAALGTPPILLTEGRCVGGSTVINGGMAWRTPDHVLERWAWHAPLMGVTAAEMEPYFRRVEQRLHVSYQDAGSIGRDSRLFQQAALNRRWTVIPSRRAQLHCAGCNMCTQGCPTAAKRSMLVTNIPRAISRGARVYPHCRAEKITWAGKRATGVVAALTPPDGGPVRRLAVRSRIVVLAGGAVQTPALLQRSGFRSPSRQLGHHLALHPNAKLIALFDEDLYGWQGVHQAFQVREFQRDGILIALVNLAPSLLAPELPYRGPQLTEKMEDYNQMTVAGCLIEDSVFGRLMHLPFVGPVPRYQITGADLDRIVRGLTLTAEIMFEAGAREVLMPFTGMPPFTRDDLPRLARWPARRSDLELVSIHVMGTARMSSDPTRGVVSSVGEVHDAAGLFVADASILPGPLGVNPMESVAALALRTGEWIACTEAK